MAHPVYKLEALIEKYPLIETAYEDKKGDIEAAFFFLGGEKGCIAAPRMMLELIDQNVDGTRAEKQDLMVALIYSFGQDTSPIDPEAFAEVYGVNASNILDALPAAKRSAVFPTDAARIAAVQSICTFRIMVDLVRDSKSTGDAADDEVNISALNQGVKEAGKSILPNLNAPELAKAFQASVQELLTAAAPAAPSQDNPVRARPRHPRL